MVDAPPLAARMLAARWQIGYFSMIFGLRWWMGPAEVRQIAVRRLPPSPVLLKRAERDRAYPRSVSARVLIRACVPVLPCGWLSGCLWAVQTKQKDGAGLKLAMCVHNAFLCLLSAAMFAGAGYEVCLCACALRGSVCACFVRVALHVHVRTLACVQMYGLYVTSVGGGRPTCGARMTEYVGSFARRSGGKLLGACIIGRTSTT